jgi:hypothetical protein
MSPKPLPDVRISMVMILEVCVPRPIMSSVSSTGFPNERVRTNQASKRRRSRRNRLDDTIVKATPSSPATERVPTQGVIALVPTPIASAASPSLSPAFASVVGLHRA